MKTTHSVSRLSATCLSLVLGAIGTSLASAREEPNNELVQLIAELLRDQEKDMRALALEQIRSDAPGEANTRQFAAQLPQLPAPAQVELLRALAERGDEAARPAVIDVLDASRDESVRVAAIGALGALGEPADWQRLEDLLSEGTDTEKTAARSSLARLQGPEVSRSIAAQINRSPSKRRVALIKILADRRAFETVPTLLDAAVDSDPTVRVAAMAVLGELASPRHMPDLVQGVLKARPGSERAAAEKSVMFVCARISDKETQADPILQAMRKLKPADQVAMLSTLGRIGGRAALQEVEKAIDNRDPRRHSAGVRALSNWPDASVASQLIKLAKSDEHADHQTTALRALIRVAPLPDGRTDEQKLELLGTAMSMCKRDAERLLALDRARAIRLPATLRFVLPYLKQNRFAQQACKTIVELAHHRNLREPNKAEFDSALDQVIQVSQDATLVERAKRYKKGQTWARPKAG